MPLSTDTTGLFEITQYQHSFFGLPNQVPKSKKERLIMSAEFDEQSNRLTCRTVADNWWGRLRWNLFSDRKSIDNAVQKAFEYHYKDGITILSDWSKQSLNKNLFAPGSASQKVSLLEDHRDKATKNVSGSILDRLQLDYEDAIDEAERLLNPSATTTTRHFNIPLHASQLVPSHEPSKEELEKAVKLLTKAVTITQHALKNYPKCNRDWNQYLEEAQKRLRIAENKLTYVLAKKEITSPGKATPHLNHLIYGSPLPQNDNAPAA